MGSRIQGFIVWWGRYVKRNLIVQPTLVLMTLALMLLTGPMPVLAADSLETLHTVQDVRNLVADEIRVLQTFATDIPAGDAAADQALRQQTSLLLQEVQLLYESVNRPDVTWEDALLTLKEAESLSWKIRRLENFVAARKARPDAPFGLATADSMTLVYPKELPCLCSVDTPRITMAKGEYENIQVVVMPYDTALSGLQAKVLNIVGPDGKAVSPSVLKASVAPLGSVLVTASTVYLRPPSANSPGNYQGFIPDPIRADIAAVNVTAGDMQPYWVELYAGVQTEPGDYRVTLGFTADGIDMQTLTIDVRVWPFQIADRPHLPTAMSINPAVVKQVYGITDPAQWDQMWWKYIDFLESFKIEPDFIYRFTPPSVEELLAIKNKWGLRRFNVYYIYPVSLFDIERPETWQKTIDEVLDLIGAAMTEYEKAGLAEHAYVYGFDESRAEYYPLAKTVMRQLKERFPNLPIMTTLIDRTLGVTSGLAGLVDIWTPGVEQIDHTARAVAQQQGDQVYWYTHQAVRAPLPNWFNGYEPIDTRALLGPLSYRLNLDGFLYYNIARWINQGVMRDGIFSFWDARTWNQAYGDGSLFYPGIDGPLASQRIQNFRDGMEDYNLLMELEQRLAKAVGLPAAMAEEARRLLSAEDVAGDQRQYTKDASSYREWRDRVADMIVALDDLSADMAAEGTEQVAEPNAQPITASSLYEQRLAVLQRAWISYPRWHIPETGPFDVSVHIDPRLQVQSVTVYLEGEVIYEGTEVPTGPVACLDLPDNRYQISLRVVDQAGQTWEDRMFVTVKTVDIVTPQSGERLRGMVPFQVAPIYALDEIEHVSISLIPILAGEPQEEQAWVVYQGSHFPIDLGLDTTTLPDGPYAVQYSAVLRSGRVSQNSVNIVVHNWETLVDEFEVPIPSGWFGVIEQKKTVTESAGWDYDTSDAAVFFDDIDRRIWLGDGEGHLVWEAPGVRRVGITLYTRIADMVGLRLSFSSDGATWVDASYDMTVDALSDAGWLKCELHAQTDEEGLRYFRITLPDNMRADMVQLGKVELLSPVKVKEP